jgi:hypothetical protein
MESLGDRTEDRIHPLSVVREGFSERPAAGIEEHPQKIEEQEGRDDDQGYSQRPGDLQTHQDIEDRGEDEIEEYGQKKGEKYGLGQAQDESGKEDQDDG